MADPGSLVLLTRLSRAVYRHATEPLLGMLLKEYMGLRQLDHEGGMTQGRLAEVMNMDANQCVLLLNDLEQRGWAARTRDPADRRRHLVDITEAGSKALATADETLDSLEGDLLVGLSRAERRQLRGLLDKALVDFPSGP